jgi:hypothetical protein
MYHRYHHRKQAGRSNTCAGPVPPRTTDGGIGLLNVRERPNAKSKIVDTVRGLDAVWVDNDPLIDRFKGWKHIYHVTREGFVEGEGENYVSGWVSAKYLKPVKCPPNGSRKLGKASGTKVNPSVIFQGVLLRIHTHYHQEWSLLDLGDLAL